MTPHRAGNLEKLKLLIDSRNEPWSAAERLSHRLLRAAHITGWETNLPVYIDGQVYYLDIAFSGRSWRSRLTVDGTRRTRTSSSQIDGARMRSWWPTVGEFYASPGRCCATILGPSLAPLSTRSTETHHGCAPRARLLRLGARERCRIRVIQSSSAPAPSGSISSTLRPVSAASCSTIVR